MRRSNSNIQCQRRSGNSSVLAMLFLVLFSTLAIGFYAATNTAMQVSANDEHVSRAFIATESGMDFMKYELAHVDIPTSQTDATVITDKLLADLKTQMEGYPNMGAMTIEKSSPTVIQIPGNLSDRIKLDSRGDSTFRATITVGGPQNVAVKANGYFTDVSGSSRAIQLGFTRSQNPDNAFNFAVASKGKVSVTKGDITSAPGVDPKIVTIMSALGTGNSVNVGGSGHITVGGDVSIVAGAAASIGSNVTVGGSSNTADILANHVKTVAAPDFPTVDPTPYRDLATTQYTSGVPLSNVWIPPGLSHTFTSNQTIKGIMYIYAPCNIVFQGDVKLQGFIVVEGGAPGINSLKFSGNFTMSQLPDDPAYDALRTTSGVAILAKDTDVAMTGSASKSAVSVKGNIIANTFTATGAADVVVDKGTIMTYSTGSNAFTMSSSKSIKFTATGAHNQPSMGINYSTYYLPDPGTYEELEKQ